MNSLVAHRFDLDVMPLAFSEPFCFNFDFDFFFVLCCLSVFLTECRIKTCKNRLVKRN